MYSYIPLEPSILLGPHTHMFGNGLGLAIGNGLGLAIGSGLGLAEGSADGGGHSAAEMFGIPVGVCAGMLVASQQGPLSISVVTHILAVVFSAQRGSLV